MKRKLVVVLLLLCMASLMATMAYNTATITNAATLKVVNTNSALLALRPTPTTWIGNKDGTAVIEDGNLVFRFGVGMGGNFYGLQKNSVYEWYYDDGNMSTMDAYGLFTIYNQSNEKIEVSIDLNTVPTGVTVEFLPMRGYPVEPWTAAPWTMAEKLTPNESRSIGVRITIDDTAAMTTTNMELVVTAKAVA